MPDGSYMNGIIDCAIYYSPDFTHYWSVNSEVEDKIKPASGGADLRNSFDVGISVRKPGSQRVIPARVHGCHCFRGTKWSLTFRLKESYPSIRKRPPAPPTSTNWTPTAKVGKVKSQRIPFLNSMSELCEILYAQIFEEDDNNANGIVIVTGSTDLGKSRIVRGLIDLFLRKSDHRERQRPPHLVSFEDPIESYYIDPEDLPPDRERWLDYTPREKGPDADTLAASVDNALRQSPTVFFAGETRKERDWATLLGFAGSGHLAFTTAHAGSLTEAMGRVFRATSTTSAEQRSELADRIKALIHLRGAVTASNRILVPALWRRTMTGKKALMADGRSSLLPNRPADAELLISSFGRSWFARMLLEKAKHRWRRSDFDEISRNVENQAVQWDLGGL